MTVYCGSVPAIARASLAYYYGPRAGANDSARLADALLAMHDAGLGLDRSVCLRDVVRWLHQQDQEQALGAFTLGDAAELLQREWGAGTTPDTGAPL